MVGREGDDEGTARCVAGLISLLFLNVHRQSSFAIIVVRSFHLVHSLIITLLDYSTSSLFNDLAIHSASWAFLFVFFSASDTFVILIACHKVMNKR